MVLSYTLLALLLLLLVALGLWGSLRIKRLTDLLVANRSLGTLLCAGGLAATHLGAGFVLATGEYGFTSGLAGAFYGIACGLGLLLVGTFVAEPIRRLPIMTTADYIAFRYGGRLLPGLTALLSLLALMGILVAQLGAAQRTLAMVGLDPMIGTILMALALIIAVAAGGTHSVSLIGLVLTIAAAIGVIVVASATVVQAGGWQSLKITLSYQSHINTKDFFGLTGMGWSTVVWLMLPTVLYTLVGQDIYQRFLGSRKPEIASRSSLLAGLFLIVISFVPAVMGMAARGLLPGVDRGQDAIAALVSQILPPPCPPCSWSPSWPPSSPQPPPSFWPPSPTSPWTSCASSTRPKAPRAPWPSPAP